jgi:hypothetical protein
VNWGGVEVYFLWVHVIGGDKHHVCVWCVFERCVRDVFFVGACVRR